MSGKDTLHHTVIVSEKTPRGERWNDEPVTRFEVHQRLRATPQKPIIQKEWGSNRRFVMALCKGDCIEMDNESGGRSVYVVRSCSKRDIVVRLHNDARTDKQIMKAGERKSIGLARVMKCAKDTPEK